MNAPSKEAQQPFTSQRCDGRKSPPRTRLQHLLKTREARRDGNPKETHWNSDAVTLNLLAGLTALCQMCVVNKYCARAWWQLCHVPVLSVATPLFSVLLPQSLSTVSPQSAALQSEISRQARRRCLAETHYSLTATLLLKREKKNLTGEKATVE